MAETPAAEISIALSDASIAVNDAPSPSNGMSLEEKFQLVRGVGEECIQEEELRNLLEKKPNPICYDGFEPSGRMHIAQVPYILCLFAVAKKPFFFLVLMSVC
ncbi:uncharacterized protein A4U43_C08F3450 [Asparagus officinalis]|nr:uncharacterized protein A4U43_C08F3450 [Asparagus officinalis]